MTGQAVAFARTRLRAASTCDARAEDPTRRFSGGDEPSPAASPTCPLCHTPRPPAAGAAAPGADWRCTRCGQAWSAHRLATLTAYARHLEHGFPGADDRR
jgi:hypothetical protein